MTSYEGSSLTEIEAVLDGLDEATSLEVFDATRGYAPRAIASVAASRADAAGGGGGGGAATLLGPYAFAHDDTPDHQAFGLNFYIVGGEPLAEGTIIIKMFAIFREDYSEGVFALGVGHNAGNLSSNVDLTVYPADTGFSGFVGNGNASEPNPTTYDPYQNPRSGTTPGLPPIPLLTTTEAATTGEADVYLLVAVPA